MKRSLLAAAALALLTATALADGPNWKFVDPPHEPTASEVAAFEAKEYDRVEPPQKVVVTQRGLRAWIARFAVEDNEMVDLPPGTVMTIIMRNKNEPSSNCVLLPEAATKGLRAWSPSGCFWVELP